MRCEWNQLLHAITDPTWAIGLAMQARWAGEASIPPVRRFMIAFGPMILSAVLSGGSALAGGWVALDGRLTAIEREDMTIKAMIQERSTLREQQMREFNTRCSEAHARIAILESRQRDADMLAAELRALIRHEANEIGNKQN